MPEPLGARPRPIGMNRRTWVPAAAVAAAAAVLVAVTGVSMLSGDRPTAGPPVLRLAATGGPQKVEDSRPAAPGNNGGSLRLTGTLPAEPSEARVRDLPGGAAPVNRVRQLATALGETATPKRVDGTWSVGDLVVTDGPGNPWTWGQTCGPDTPVSSDGGVAMENEEPVCAGGTVSSGRVKPLPLPAVPEQVLLTDAQALAATATIRNALAQGDAPTRVEGLSVVVEPVAGSLPTSGVATLLQLSSQARLIGATGSLSTGRDGDLYPLRSARKAFDAIPLLAMGAPCDASGCPEGPAVTGARLGLSRVTLDGGGAVLVPAWLFTVEGSSGPLVALAVADRFLGGPVPSVTEPGTTEPADPRGRESFAFDGAYADADPKVLVIRYGDSGTCPSETVNHDVAQQSDRVVVTLTRTPMPAGQACTSDYRASARPGGS